MLLTKNKEELEEILSQEDINEEVDDQRDRIIFFGLLIGSAIVGLNVILLLLTGWLAVKPPPTLVRDPYSGEAFRVSAADAPPTETDVLNFAKDRMHRLHSWTGLIPSKKTPGMTVSDPGILVSSQNSNNRKVTTSAYEASFALTESIRTTVLESIAQQTPQQVFENEPDNMAMNTYVLLMPRKWLEPKKLKGDRWKVTLVADIKVFNPSTPQGKLVSKFNKDIYIAETPNVPLIYPDVVYQALAYSGRAEGFQIDMITDTQLGEIRAPR